MSAIVTYEREKAPDWLKVINWDEFEKLAHVGYIPEQLAMYYNVPKHEFMYWYMMVDSELEYHYQRGQLFYQAKEAIGMVGDAPNNATQALRLDKLRKEVEFSKARNEILYGGQ